MSKRETWRMTDSELWEYVNDCAATVSYYEAAEGNYAAETDDRNAAKAKFREARAALKARGLEWVNERGYLTS